MEDKTGNQRIHCNVESCRYHNTHEQMCDLQAIIVKPCMECCNGKAEDESMCGSYIKENLDK